MAAKRCFIITLYTLASLVVVNPALARDAFGTVRGPFPRSGIHCRSPNDHGCAATKKSLPTDQTLLAPFALNSPNDEVRLAAVQFLWDQPTLEKVAASSWGKNQNAFIESQIRVYAAGAILDTNALERIASLWLAKKSTTDDIEVIALSYRIQAIASLRRKLQELGIENRTGRLRIEMIVDGGTPTGNYGSVTAFGEEVAVSIGTDTTIFVTGSWHTEMSSRLSVPSNHGTVVFLPAPVNWQLLIDHLVSASQKQG